MPEYDPTNYPRPMSDDLTRAEIGRDVPGPDPAAWPASNLVPETYAGPPPAREYETSGLGRSLTNRPPGRPAAASPRGDNPPAAPGDGAILPSIAPPPGHTAQP